jgi:5'-3' exonuclease
MILIDADILCYRIGFATQEETSGKYILDVLTHYISNILVQASDSEEFQLYLTGKTNFRNEIATTAPYKGNRKSEKPKHMGFIRAALQGDWGAIVSVDEEADDAIAIKATELGDDCVMCSVDKDFDQIPGWHYNFVKQHKYYVTPEEGLFFFYRQILMGDRIDNIIGINGIGEKKSAKILEGMTEQEMYDKCVELHESEERVIENARLLWLRREEGQLWEPPHETTK